MASNAPNTESAVERAPSGDIDSEATIASLDESETAAATTRKGARKRKTTGTSNTSGPTSDQPPVSTAATKPVRTPKKAARSKKKPAAKIASTADAANVAKRTEGSDPLDREALLELDAVRKLIEVGEEKGDVKSAVT